MNAFSFARLLAVAAFAIALNSAASAASFDCKAAKSPVEKSICASEKLSALDESLGAYYANAGEQLGAAKACLRSDQRAWLSQVRNACSDAACLERAYLNRLAELDALQPGASAVRYVELPRVATLITILPPAEDTVAVREPKSLTPLNLRGAMLDQTVDGDGLAIRADGKLILVTPTMFYDDATQKFLDALKLQKSASYEVRGFRDPAPAGDKLFALSRCRAIYRLP